MNASELRNKYIDFFTSHGHVEISGKSLVPENDPTVLFTTAGMHPLVPYILGEPHPLGKRLVSCQKCIRTNDIDEVGDFSHLTFFEMLGNWSLGDYFKEEAINMSLEFLTSEKWLGFSPDKLHITVFSGDDLVPPDSESAKIWQSVGIPEDRIYYLGKDDNWWGPAGTTGPCGPDSEMFIEMDKPACSEECRPGCECGKYMEVWNDVFMQYNKTADGKYEPLAQYTVDTGMGVERTTAVLAGKQTVYETELFLPVINIIEEATGKLYGANPEDDRSFRIIADHVKAAVFILADPHNIRPSNLGQGYVLRRLIRRAIRHMRKLSLEREFVKAPAVKFIDVYKVDYHELDAQTSVIVRELQSEEHKFSNALQKGEREFEKIVTNLLKNPKKVIPGRIAFRLYDTYGFPLEITEELASEHGLHVDREGFQKAEVKHQQLSKQGAEKSFKGGLADHTDKVKQLHTATHLLHQALRMVLGNHVEQKGSNITSERLRFDFSHPSKMSKEEIQKVEGLVNQQIQKDLPVTVEVMALEEAEKTGAAALFGEKYEKKVKVYSIGDFSKEVCGGPHVEHTGVLGKFIIKKEQSSSANVRRIRAVLQSE